MDIIKKYFSDDIIVRRVHHLHEISLSDEAKQYIIDCFMNAIKSGRIIPGSSHILINPDNTPLLAKTYNEKFPNYPLIYKENNINKFFNGDIDILCTKSDYISLLRFINGRKKYRELKRLTINHFDFFLKIVDELKEYKNISDIFVHIFSMISNDVFNNVITDNYSSLLSLININDAFLCISWDRYKKLILWDERRKSFGFYENSVRLNIKTDGIPSQIIYKPLVVIKLYLFYHPNKSTDIVLEILRVSMFLNNEQFKMKLSHIISCYKCDYEKIMKRIPNDPLKGGAAELVKNLVEKHR